MFTITATENKFMIRNTVMFNVVPRSYLKKSYVAIAPVTLTATWARAAAFTTHVTTCAQMFSNSN